MANLTLRSSTGQPLSFAELDGNFEYFTGSHAVTGSITATQGFIGNVTGTASYASTASYVTTAQTASYFGGTVTSASYALTASYALNGGGGGSTNTSSLLVTASFSDPNVTFTKGDGSTFDVDISTLTVTNAATSSYYDGFTIDAEIYLSPTNQNTDFPILFSSVTSNLGGYGYPFFDTQTSAFTYNPNKIGRAHV